MDLKYKGKNRHIQAVLFDMDGVLVDSIALHIESWNQVLTSIGLPPFSHELYFSALGHTNKEMLAVLSEYNHIHLSIPQIEDILTQKEAVFRENISLKAACTPGVIDWLDFLIKNHILCSVASSATMANIAFILYTLNIADHFSTAISGSYLPVGKPHPQIFLSAAASLDIPPEACLVVEDAPAGIQAAKSANMFCLAIATSYPKNKLAEADLVIGSLAEINPETIFNNT